MKTIVHLLLCILTSSTWSQTDSTKSKDLPQPEWTYKVIYIDSNRSSVQLEQKTPSEKIKANVALHITGIGKVKSKLSVLGAESSCKIYQSDTLIFVARLNSNELDPRSQIELIRLESNKNDRYIIDGTLGSFEGYEKKTDFQIDYSATKLGSQSYVIKLLNLPLGEYAFRLKDKPNQFHLFGIDQRLKDITSPEMLNPGDSCSFYLEGEIFPGTIIKRQGEYFLLSYKDHKGKRRKTRRAINEVEVEIKNAE